jgi:hypothetical protein
MLFSIACAFCHDATLTAYEADHIHFLMRAAGWAWISDKPMCSACIRRLPMITLRRIQKDIEEMIEGL